MNVRRVDVGIGRSLESLNPREISDPNVSTCNFFANEARKDAGAVTQSGSPRGERPRDGSRQPREMTQTTLYQDAHAYGLDVRDLPSRVLPMRETPRRDPWPIRGKFVAVLL